MPDLKTLGMTELIALHNDMAEKLGLSTETSFKSLAAARGAISVLEAKMNQATATTETTTAEPTLATDGEAIAPAADMSKYSSTGKRGPNQGVGVYAKELIIAGKSNIDALNLVKARFPDAKTTTGCIAFYRTALAKGPNGESAARLREKAAEFIAKAEAVEAVAKAKLLADAATAQEAVDAAVKLIIDAELAKQAETVTQ